MVYKPSKVTTATKAQCVSMGLWRTEGKQSGPHNAEIDVLAQLGQQCPWLDVSCYQQSRVVAWNSEDGSGVILPCPNGSRQLCTCPKNDQIHRIAEP